MNNYRVITSVGTLNFSACDSDFAVWEANKINGVDKGTTERVELLLESNGTFHPIGCGFTLEGAFEPSTPATDLSILTVSQAALYRRLVSLMNKKRTTTLISNIDLVGKRILESTARALVAHELVGLRIVIEDGVRRFEFLLAEQHLGQGLFMSDVASDNPREDYSCAYKDKEFHCRKFAA